MDGSQRSHQSSTNHARQVLLPMGLAWPGPMSRNGRSATSSCELPVETRLHAGGGMQSSLDWQLHAGVHADLISQYTLSIITSLKTTPARATAPRRSAHPSPDTAATLSTPLTLISLTDSRVLAVERYESSKRIKWPRQRSGTLIQRGRRVTGAAHLMNDLVQLTIFMCLRLSRVLDDPHRIRTSLADDSHTGVVLLHLMLRHAAHEKVAPAVGIIERKVAI